jgi:type 1 glutamine amidotransferase
MNITHSKQTEVATSPKILILSGGWEGHYPHEFSAMLREDLIQAGCEVTLTTDLSVLDATDHLAGYDLIVPNWTKGKLEDAQVKILMDTIGNGCGLGGFHGGMGDAFRGCTVYEWICGGHFVGHPHVGNYEVSITREGRDHPVTQALAPGFSWESEQYYMLVDPGIQVLADSRYSFDGYTCDMPVVWVKKWGKGKVFYSALGHAPKEFERMPQVREMTVRGLLWAVRDSF